MTFFRSPFELSSIVVDPKCAGRATIEYVVFKAGCSREPVATPTPLNLHRHHDSVTITKRRSVLPSVECVSKSEIPSSSLVVRSGSSGRVRECSLLDLMYGVFSHRLILGLIASPALLE